MPSEKITKEKIIKAVLECAFSDSVGSASLSKKKKKLGIKKASLYNHYESRDAIIDDTINYCGECLSRLSLIPAEMEMTARKYNCDVVLKGLVHRWIKIFEKEPFIQIYSFIESQKYFSSKIHDIKNECGKRFLNQIEIALNSLENAGKISVVSGEYRTSRAESFYALLNSLVDSYICSRKKVIRQNPKSGKGELFSFIAENEPDFKKADRLIENFCLSLR